MNPAIRPRRPRLQIDELPPLPPRIAPRLGEFGQLDRGDPRESAATVAWAGSAPTFVDEPPAERPQARTNDAEVGSALTASRGRRSSMRHSQSSVKVARGLLGRWRPARSGVVRAAIVGLGVILLITLVRQQQAVMETRSELTSIHSILAEATTRADVKALEGAFEANAARTDSAISDVSRSIEAMERALEAAAARTDSAIGDVSRSVEALARKDPLPEVTSAPVKQR